MPVSSPNGHAGALILRRYFYFLSLCFLIQSLTACAIKPYVMDHTAAALASQTSAPEEDLLLAREASAFYLKFSESILREAPHHPKLAETVAAGFAQYAYAFVAFDADKLEPKDAKSAQKIRLRAARLYARARGHAMNALESGSPGFANALAQTDPAKFPRLHPSQIGLAYWAAASWGGMISLSKDDPDQVADFPQVIRLARMAWEINPDFGDGALASLMGTLEAARPGGSRQHAAVFFDQAMKASKSQSAGPWVAKAESMALADQDREAFERLLRQALEISAKHRNLQNEVMRERAEWLLDMAGDLF